MASLVVELEKFFDLDLTGLNDPILRDDKVLLDF